MDIPLRVVIADDHPMFLRGLRVVLEGVDGVEVVGEARTGQEAVAVVKEACPDALVLDLHMPGMNGIAVARQVGEERPQTAVLMLTMVEDDDSIFAALRAGARGYLLKGADADDLVRAIKAVADGEAIFGPGVAQRVLGLLTGASDRANDEPFPELTERERQVVELIADGLGNHAIAAQLGLSPKTVMNYVSNIFSKLHVADRYEMIVRARRAGFGGEGRQPP